MFKDFVLIKDELTKLRIDAISRINEKLECYKSKKIKMMIEINKIDSDEGKEFLFKNNVNDLIEFLHDPIQR